MEKITMIYEGSYHESDLTRIEMSIADKEDEGLVGSDICGRFEEFMEAIGFSSERITNYFTK